MNRLRAFKHTHPQILLLGALGIIATVPWFSEPGAASISGRLRTKPVTISVGNPGDPKKKQSAPIMLRVPEVSFTDVLAMSTRIYAGQQRFYVFHSNSFIVYDEKRNIVSKSDTGGTFYPSDPSVDVDGNLYLINSATDEIMSLSSTGQWRGSFRVQERPYSLAVLSDGRVIIASPNNGKLLHIYDASGHKIRSFGDIAVYDPINEAQNLFLNRGKVVVDSADNIYFVFKYAPAATVLKFSRNGKLISEFALEGDAINLQSELAQKYLSAKPSNDVGSIVISNSATIDPSTGHLWICMNGSSRSGVVYEYSPRGKKLHEYSFITALPAIRPGVLTYVTDILAMSSLICVFVDNAVCLVSLTKPVDPGGLVFAQDACPQPQTWPGCSANCPQGSCPSTKDCKAALQATVGESPLVTGSTCQSLGAGQGTPAKPNGGCIATVTTCNNSTGIQTTTTANLDCNPVKYECDGGECVVDCNGTFPNSNCNNTCGGGGGGCDQQPPQNGCPGDCRDWDWDQCMCVYVGCSPILIDDLGNGFHLTDANQGVDFNLHGDGTAERLGWTAAGSDDAFLALDRNANGAIDSGAELFGNFTPQPPAPHKNGFLALAEFDKAANGGNGDGRITSSDAVFSRLRLWQDSDHNGRSEPGELHTLPSLGLAAIDLDYSSSKRTDQFGNQFRYRAKVRDSHGAQLGRWAWDVFFVSQ